MCVFSQNTIVLLALDGAGDLPGVGDEECSARHVLGKVTSVCFSRENMINAAQLIPVLFCTGERCVLASLEVPKKHCLSYY